MKKQTSSSDQQGAGPAPTCFVIRREYDPNDPLFSAETWKHLSSCPDCHNWWKEKYEEDLVRIKKSLATIRRVMRALRTSIEYKTDFNEELDNDGWGDWKEHNEKYYYDDDFTF